MTGTLSLVVRRTIDASPSRLFDAWTKPEQLRSWWGPAGVRCVGVELDLRVGGRYRIANGLPDGSVIHIDGIFLAIEPPTRLVYTWRVDSSVDAGEERVTVRFEARGSRTEVIVVHEQIGSEPLRDGHASGWGGCLDGLVAFIVDG